MRDVVMVVDAVVVPRMLHMYSALEADVPLTRHELIGDVVLRPADKLKGPRGSGAKGPSAVCDRTFDTRRDGCRSHTACMWNGRNLWHSCETPAGLIGDHEFVSNAAPPVPSCLPVESSIAH